jgi:AcrR family transcriptional regulator
MQRRAVNTRNNLMRAAEQLIARQGLENVTNRAITEAAGQKNESALQYHFGNRDGLIEAIHRERNAQIQKKRTELLDGLLEREPQPGLREVCALMVEPAFLLARSDRGFRHYVTGFGREIALTDMPPSEYLLARHQRGTRQTQILLRAALSHLDDDLFQHRFDSAARFAGLSMSGHARQRGAFRGKASDIFFNMLVDMMAGLLAAVVSAETRAALAR